MPSLDELLAEGTHLVVGFDSDNVIAVGEKDF